MTDGPARASAGARAISPQEAEEEIQNLLALGERYRAEIGAVEEQRAILGQVVEEYARARKTLDSLKVAKSGDEVLVPLGAGTHVRARLEEPATVLSSLGARVVLECSIDEALARLEERQKGTESAAARLDEEARRMGDEMREINARLQSFAGPGGAEMLGGAPAGE